MTNLTCSHCKRAYRAKPYMASKSKNHFCGQRCYGLWQKAHPRKLTLKRVTIQCLQCGTAFQKRPGQVRGRNLCSASCRYLWMRSHMAGQNNPAWRGGHTCYRGPNWTHQRRKARLRDGNTCQHCGSQSHLIVHHKRPFNLFTDYRKANRLPNLITLCPKCHGIAEDLFWKSNPQLVPQCRIPLCLKEKPCTKCGGMFAPNSGAQRVCRACCQHTCRHCNKPFSSPRWWNKVAYCSKACRNAHVAIKPKPCKGCGKMFVGRFSSRQHCSFACFMTRANPRRAFSEKRKRAALASGRLEA